MSFYNPYMKTPDWGQGISDIGNQLMLMMMLKRMMGPSEKTERTPGVTEPPTGRHGMSMMAGAQPQPGQMPPTGGPPMTGQMIQGAAPSQMGQQPPPMNPQMLQMLIQMLMQRQ
jgi:hypothetical protein